MRSFRAKHRYPVYNKREEITLTRKEIVKMGKLTKIVAPLALGLAAVALIIHGTPETPHKMSGRSSVVMADHNIPANHRNSVASIVRMEGVAPGSSCSGYLIANDVVLTAKHCLFDINSVRIKVGNRVSVPVAARAAQGDADVGLYYLSEAARYGLMSLPTTAPVKYQASDTTGAQDRYHTRSFKISFVGFGASDLGQIVHGIAHPESGPMLGLLGADCDVEGGFSGSAVFDQAGRLAGVISAGLGRDIPQLRKMGEYVQELIDQGAMTSLAQDVILKLSKHRTLIEPANAIDKLLEEHNMDAKAKMFQGLGIQAQEQQ